MNTRSTLALPIFKSGQVLRFTDLNNLANYLDEQDRLTRIMLVGTGIVEGLSVKLDKDASNSPTAITIVSGIGISSDGHTFFLEQDLILTKYYASSLQKYDIECPPSTNGATNGSTTLPAYELLEDDVLPETLTNGSGTPQVNDLDSLPDGKYIALIFQKDLSGNGSRCFSQTESATTSQRYESKVYLIELATYSVCQENTQTQTGTNGTPPGNGFVKPYIPRFGYKQTTGNGTPEQRIDLSDIRSFDSFYQNYKSICSGAFQVIQNAYEKTYTTYHSLLGLTPTNPFSNLKAQLDLLLDEYEGTPVGSDQRLHIQYLYDYLRDLIAAHNEFIDSAFDLRLGGQLLPNTCAHPRHLVLAKIEVDRDAKNTNAEPGACRSSFRSSAFHEENTGKSRKSVDLMERMRKMVDIAFSNITRPATTPYSGPYVRLPIPNDLSGLRITPSLAYTAPLSARAMPFYYDAHILDNWSFYLRETYRLETVLGYQLHQSATPPYDEPLLYELEAYTFFRIEGLIGTPVTGNAQTPGAYEILRQKQQDLDAPFDIQFVKLSNLLNGLGAQELMPGDLQQVYEAVNRTIWCILKGLNAPDSLKTTLFPDSLVDFNYDTFESQYKNFTGAANQNFAEVDCRKTLLKNLQDEYAKRRESFHLFHHFADQHPGLEHLAGVPKGGTLVVAYADVPGKPGPVVVGDFALPYTCCADRGGVVFPETYVAGPPGYFCQKDDKSYELITYPLGGQLEWSLAPANPNRTTHDYITADASGKYYFHPDRLSRDDDYVNGQAVINLVYSKYRNRSTGMITVYQTPEFIIEVESGPTKKYDGNGKLISQTVVFRANNIIPAGAGTNLKWKWMVAGEPAPLHTTPTGFQVEFPYSEGLIYKVQLIAENGICRTEKEMEFALCADEVMLTLLSDAEFAQAPGAQVRVRAVPADGVFQLIDPDHHVILPETAADPNTPDEYLISLDDMPKQGDYRLRYALPQCLQDASVDFKVATPPIDLDKGSFCSDDDTNYPIRLTPAGGQITPDTAGVILHNNQYFFNPSLVRPDKFMNGLAAIQVDYTPPGATVPLTRTLQVFQVPEIEMTARRPVYEPGAMGVQNTCLLKGYTIGFRVKPDNLWSSCAWEVMETGKTAIGSSTNFEFRFSQGHEFRVKVIGSGGPPVTGLCPPEKVEIVQILCPQVKVGFDLAKAAQEQVLIPPTNQNDPPTFLFSKSAVGGDIPQLRVSIQVNQPGGMFSMEYDPSGGTSFVPVPAGVAVQVAPVTTCAEREIKYFLDLNAGALQAGRYRVRYWIDDCTDSIDDVAEFILQEFIPIPTDVPQPIDLAKDQFCSDDDTNYPIKLTPPAKTFVKKPGVVEQNGQYFFNPSLVKDSELKTGLAHITLEYTDTNSNQHNRTIDVYRVPEIEIISKAPIFRIDDMVDMKQKTCKLIGYNIEFRVIPELWTTYAWEVLETGKTSQSAANKNTISFNFLFVQEGVFHNEYHVKVVASGGLGDAANSPCPAEKVEVVQILCPAVKVGFDLVNADQDKVLVDDNPIPTFWYSTENPDDSKGIPELIVWIKVNYTGGVFKMERFNQNTQNYEIDSDFIVQVDGAAGTDSDCNDVDIAYSLNLNAANLVAGNYHLSYWIEDCTDNIMDTVEFILQEFTPPSLAASKLATQPPVSTTSRTVGPTDILSNRIVEHQEIMEALAQDTNVPRSNAFKFAKTLMDSGQDLPALNDNFEKAVGAVGKKVAESGNDDLRANYEMLADTIIRYYLDRLIGFDPQQVSAGTKALLGQKVTELKDSLNFKEIATNWHGEELKKKLGATAVDTLVEILNKNA